uniref:Uncharacterized protein n=1 Tax=Anguilla anguilla TaxID=7936 RepID=A0A0E9Q6P6_ANGAN
MKHSQSNVISTKQCCVLTDKSIDKVRKR